VLVKTDPTPSNNTDYRPCNWKQKHWNSGFPNLKDLIKIQYYMDEKAYSDLEAFLFLFFFCKVKGNIATSSDGTLESLWLQFRPRQSVLGLLLPPFVTNSDRRLLIIRWKTFQCILSFMDLGPDKKDLSSSFLDLSMAYSWSLSVDNPTFIMVWIKLSALQSVFYLLNESNRWNHLGLFWSWWSSRVAWKIGHSSLLEFD